MEKEIVEKISITTVDSLNLVLFFQHEKNILKIEFQKLNSRLNIFAIY